MPISVPSGISPQVLHSARWTQVNLNTNQPLTKSRTLHTNVIQNQPAPKCIQAWHHSKSSSWLTGFWLTLMKSTEKSLTPKFSSRPFSNINSYLLPTTDLFESATQDCNLTCGKWLFRASIVYKIWVLDKLQTTSLCHAPVRLEPGCLLLHSLGWLLWRSEWPAQLATKIICRRFRFTKHLSDLGTFSVIVWHLVTIMDLRPELSYSFCKPECLLPWTLASEEINV